MNDACIKSFVPPCASLCPPVFASAPCAYLCFLVPPCAFLCILVLLYASCVHCASLWLLSDDEFLASYASVAEIRTYMSLQLQVIASTGKPISVGRVRGSMCVESRLVP